MSHRYHWGTLRYGVDFGNYIDLLCSPSMRKMLGQTICYHSYWSDDAMHVVADRDELRKKLDAFPGWRAAQSEYCVMEPGRDLSMKTALRVMRIVHCDLGIVNSACWSWWLAVSNGDYKDGLLYTDWKRSGDAETILPSKLFWTLGNFSRFLRPGAIRVQIKTSRNERAIDQIIATAYLNPRSLLLTAVYINSTDEPTKIKLSATGTVQARWMPYVTSEALGDDLKPGTPFSSTDEFTLPGQSVVTFVQMH